MDIYTQYNGSAGWDLVVNGDIVMSGESFNVVSAVEDKLKGIDLGNTELDEVADTIKKKYA